MENQVQNTVNDSKFVSTRDDQELDYWTKEFGISKEELADAVKAGKTSAEAVKNYVKRVPQYA